jgi:hypothetical protein
VNCNEVRRRLFDRLLHHQNSGLRRQKHRHFRKVRRDGVRVLVPGDGLKVEQELAELFVAAGDHY